MGDVRGRADEAAPLHAAGFPPLAFLTADAIVRCLRGDPTTCAAGRSSSARRASGASSCSGSAPARVVLARRFRRRRCRGRCRVGRDRRRPSSSSRSSAAPPGRGRCSRWASACGGDPRRSSAATCRGPSSCGCRSATADVLRREGATGPGEAVMLDYKEPSLAFYQGGTIREHRRRSHRRRARRRPAVARDHRRSVGQVPEGRRATGVEIVRSGSRRGGMRVGGGDGGEGEVRWLRRRARRPSCLTATRRLTSDFGSAPGSAYTARRCPTRKKILVVQPSWVGDAVMATPTLRAIRELYPAAHISYLMRRYVKPIYAGMPWADQLITYRTGKTKAKAGKGQFFDLAGPAARGQVRPGDPAAQLVQDGAGLQDGRHRADRRLRARRPRVPARPTSCCR